MEKTLNSKILNWLQCAAWAMALLINTNAGAQTPSDKTDIGAQLDSKGISLGAFASPLPLPAGDWRVVSRIETAVNLTGGRGDAPTTVPEVTLGLKSMDPGNPIDLMLVTFTPNSLRINWLSGACNIIGSGGMPFKDDFGTLPSGMTYGCTTGRYLVSGTRGLIDNLAHGTNAINRDLYSGFVPYLASISDSSLSLNLTFNVYKGKRTTYQLYVRAPSSMISGNAFDLTSQAWAHETGLSILGALQNNTKAIAAFPVLTGSATDAAKPQKEIFSAVENTLPGKVISGSIALEEGGLPLPLPLGQWKVTSRGESSPTVSGPGASTNVSLTLRNADPKASVAAVWLGYNSKPVFQSLASSKCENKTAAIVETYGSTSVSPVVSCGIGGTYASSFRQRVLNSKTTDVAWDKANLSGLIPHAAELPDAHTWINLRVGSSESRRLDYVFFTARPATVNPNGKYLAEVRAWLALSHDALEAYLAGKPSSFMPYPAVTD